MVKYYKVILFYWVLESCIVSYKYRQKLWYTNENYPTTYWNRKTNNRDLFVYQTQMLKFTGWRTTTYIQTGNFNVTDES